MITRPPYTHLKNMTTEFGLLEHADFDEPKLEHGYCVDDVSRAFILLCREPKLDKRLEEIIELFLNFLLSAIHNDGSCHNRMDIAGHWTDVPGSGDWWGRATWALGFGAVHAQRAEQRSRALNGFNLLAQNSSQDLRANSFACLGASELFVSQPHNDFARKLLVNFALSLPNEISGNWIWPEERLGYSNGSIAEAVMATGFALEDDIFTQRGIEMLKFLLSKEISVGHFSVTPAFVGRGLDDTEIGFDQQPIEIASLADACARALSITHDVSWIHYINLAWAWFLGDNDKLIPMYNPITGGGFDGLHFRGPNTNQGAESTIALLSTAQQAYLANKTQEFTAKSHAIITLS